MKVNKLCEQCQKSFTTETWKFKFGRGRFCSLKCRGKAMPPPLYKSPKEINIIDRFFENVNKTNSCWIWIGSKTSDGYGTFGYARIIYYAHRFSYEFHNGKIPKGMFVCHKCDNPSCVNPEHLWVGTHSDNMKDASKKGRLKFRYLNFYKKSHGMTEKGQQEVTQCR